MSFFDFRRADDARRRSWSLLAFAWTFAALGCSSSGQLGSPPGVDASSNEDATARTDGDNDAETGLDSGVDEAAEEAAPSDSAPSDAGVMCPSRQGTFPCGTTVCHRATELCLDWSYYGIAPVCHPFTEVPDCGPCPTCECVEGNYCRFPSCTQILDDGGGVHLTCYN